MNDGNTIRGSIHNPQLVAAISTGMEFQISWRVKVVGRIGDDGFFKGDAKLWDNRAVTCSTFDRSGIQLLELNIVQRKQYHQ